MEATIEIVAHHYKHDNLVVEGSCGGRTFFSTVPLPGNSMEKIIEEEYTPEQRKTLFGGLLMQAHYDLWMRGEFMVDRKDET